MPKLRFQIDAVGGQKKEPIKRCKKVSYVGAKFSESRGTGRITDM